MPGKSRRGRKGKYSFQNKKQEGAVRSNTSVQPPVASQAREPAPLSNMSASPRVAPAPQTRRAASMARPMTVRNLFVTTELRTIGILAGIILIILIVLARVLA